MKFADAQSVLSTIQAGDDVEQKRGDNRAKINALFNGEPPLSASDAKKIGLKINANFGEAPTIGQQGRRQYNNAFLSRGRYFKVTIPDAPTEKQLAWGSFITKKINRYLKRSREYLEMHRSQWASVFLHGIAPKIWYNRCDPLPRYVALEDFRVPTDTEISLRNLNWFAVRKYYTEGELANTVWGKYPDKGWKNKAIASILATYKGRTTEQIGYDWSNQPEKTAELVKQNGGFHSSDAVPVIPLWHFYFKDDSNRRKTEWRLRIVPDQNITGGGSAPSEFLFDDGDTCFAKKLDNIIHVQFGDLNNKSPALWHAVRSCGFLMMEPIFHSNLLQCRFLQHVNESMNVWLRSSDPNGRARAQKVEMYDKAFLPEGITIVPQGERHQINDKNFEIALNITKNLKDQASVSYTNDAQAGQSPDETATGVMARVSAVNAMMSGLLLTAFNYQQYEYEEICRRFCLRNSDNDDVRRFQKECKDFGIDMLYLNVEMWEVEPEKPLGNGNPMMETAQSEKLIQMRPMFGTTAQQEILHEATIALTDDPKKADRWVPLDKEPQVTDAQQFAEMAFSTLMLGVPVRNKDGLNLNDQIETIIGLLAGVIARVEKTGSMARSDEIMGFQTVEQWVTKLIQQLSENEAEKPKVKQYMDALGKLMNMVKAFAQRLQEQQKKAALAEQGGENGNGAADMAKAHATIMSAKVKAQLGEEKAQQNQRHKEMAFNMEQQRKNAMTLADISREHIKTEEEVKRKRYAAYNADEPSSSD